MLEIEKWDKERVHSVMLELLYSFNYMWFLMEGWIKENCPEKIDSEELQMLSEQFGAYQAKRLEKTLPEPGEGVDRLVNYIKHSHWCAFEDIELTRISDTRLRMRTRGCTTQRAAKKWGMSHYDCSHAGLRLRTGFCRQIDPAAEVVRVFTPPDQAPEGTPEEISCEWMVTLR